MKTYVLSALFLLSALSVLNAQREETVLGRRGLGFSGIWWNWNHQLAQFDETNAYVKGSQFGLEFGKSLFLGYGRYRIHNNVRWSDPVASNFDMRFNAFKIGYAFQAYKAVHPVLNVDLGGAKATLDGEGEDRLFIVQPAAGIEFNVFRWFRVVVEGGYRFTTDSDFPGINDRDLSGAFGQATFRFGYSWGSTHKKKNYEQDWE
ncbi:MAG: hypothetical protein ACOYNO_00295 [Saprospiraceae bacterium]